VAITNAVKIFSLYLQTIMIERVLKEYSGYDMVGVKNGNKQVFRILIVRKQNNEKFRKP